MANPRHTMLVQVKQRPLVTLILFISVVTAGVYLVGLTGSSILQAYGVFLGVILAFKLLLSVLPPRKFKSEPPAGLKVYAVVPIYNEDAMALRKTLNALESQSRPVDKLFIVDDCSTDRAATNQAIRWAIGKDWVQVILLDKNVGKRHAMAEAFWRGSDADIWMTVDSDTVIEPTAVWHGLRPFHDPTVMASTGSVFALNEEKGILPSLVDLRYINAFLGERAAYSKLGAVVCACGSLSFWRGSVINDNLDDFVNQEFMGAPAVFGDDRRLTRYALDAGKVVLARESIGRTMVPEKMNHLIRQQVRWGKSFWRESYLMIRSMQVNRIAWWLTLLEVASWAGFTTAMIAALGLAIFGMSPASFLTYVVWIAVTAWARSVHVFNLQRTGVVIRPMLTFLFAPVYGLMNVFLFIPLRLYSLFTLKRGGWGTRSSVEVRLDTPATE